MVRVEITGRFARLLIRGRGIYETPPARSLMSSRKRSPPAHKIVADEAREEPESIAAAFAHLNLVARLKREIEADDDHRHRHRTGTRRG